MSDSEKPFACPSSGCHMSFTNEDHLTVHQRKHDMALDLGINGKNNLFVADQTPTPTRFIRNCEEVGLFQDLQNVNPFEETFRRAVEAGKSGTLIASEIEIIDDTLHTPHVFPHITEDAQRNHQILLESNIQDNLLNDKIEESDKTKHLKNHELTHSIVSLKNEISGSITIHSDSEPVIEEVTTARSSNLSLNGEEVQLLLKTADGRLMQLSAVPTVDPCHNNLPTLCTNQQTKQHTVVIKTPLKCGTPADEKKLNNSRLSQAKMKLKQALTKHPLGSQNTSEHKTKEMIYLSKRDNKSKIIDHHKKRDILERNRASSMRSRAKRKAWIQQLENNVGDVNDKNSVLEIEIKALRNEVTRLKTLLLAHKDCPVTKAMQKGNEILLGPKIISVASEVVPVSLIKNTSVNKSTVDFVSIKNQSTIPMKNPMIFPKVDNSSQQATIIENVPVLKVMDLGHLSLKKEERKSILVVQNTAHLNGDKLSPQSIIYQVENVASKINNKAKPSVSKKYYLPED